MNTIKIQGRVKIWVYDIFGKLRDETAWLTNTVTSTAFAAVAGLVGATDSQSAFTYLAVGTDATAAAASQTALLAEITDTGLSRHAATVTRETTTQTNDTLQLVYEWTATGTKAVEEIGVFNATSAGVMLGRKTTGTKTVNNGEKLNATYQIIFS